jgi:fatty-acyl-CoA synthase
VTRAHYVTATVEAFESFGDRTALIHGDRVLSYAELLDNVHRIARALDRYGIGRGDGLACLGGNTPEVLLLRFACHLLGVRHVAVHFGPDAEGVEHILADADLKAVVFDPRLTSPRAPVPVFAEHAGIPTVLALGPADGAGDLLAVAATQSATPVPVAAEDDDIASICYTGGTTGLPKGVTASFAGLHAALTARAAVIRSAPLPADVRFLAVTSIAYVTGDAAITMLSIGVPVELWDEFDAGAMIATLSRSRPVVTFLYPPLLYRLLDHPAVATVEKGALALVAYGSSPMSPTRLRQAIDTFGPVFFQGYAQTEVTTVTMLTVEDHARGAADRPELLASVGRVVPGTEVAIRAPDGTPATQGEIGEVCVRSPSVMTGYWNNPELTAQVLRDGWLHTGDLGYFDAGGYLYLVGRLKDMIIVNGRNCYAVPIEATLSSHPAVSQAVVVGMPSATTGEEIHAFVIPAPGARADEDDLRDLVRDTLGPVQVPTTVRFVTEVPLNAAGKPDKSALRASLPTGV